MRTIGLGVLLLTIALSGQAPPGVAESPRSPVLAIPSIVVKWDQPGVSLESVRALRWAAYLTNPVERLEVGQVTCGPPTGKTPLSHFSCEMPFPSQWAGRTFELVAWIPQPELGAPSGPRVVGAPAVE